MENNVPKIVEKLSHEEIKAQMLLKHPGLIERDPGYELISDVAYQDMLQRFRINEAAVNILLKHSKDKDILSNVKKQKDETEEAWIKRIIDVRKSRSLSGPAAGYKAIVMSIASDVLRDVVAYRKRAGKIQIVILPKKADEDLEIIIKKIKAEFSKDHVGILDDTIVISGPVEHKINLHAVIKLFPDSPMSDFEEAKTRFKTQFEKNRRFGFDITESWVYSNLHGRGIYGIDLNDFQSVKVDKYQSPILGDLKIVFGGYDE